VLKLRLARQDHGGTLDKAPQAATTNAPAASPPPPSIRKKADYPFRWYSRHSRVIPHSRGPTYRVSCL